MDMDHWGSALLFGSIFIAVLAVALYLFIPSIREAEKKAATFRNRPLEEKYANEIASGEIVIREFDQNKAYRRVVWVSIGAGLVIIINRQFQNYIHHMNETCAQLWGLSSFMVHMTCITAVGILISNILIFVGVKEYRESLKDGYFPPRKSSDFSKIKISKKITKKIKLKMQFQLMIYGVLSILILSLPLNITLILTQNSKHSFHSLSELNDYFQTACIYGLKHINSR